MRGVTWLLGVMVVLLGLELRPASSGGWTAVWISAAVLWFFVGCGLGVLSLNRLVSAKIAERAGGRHLGGSAPTPSADSGKRENG